MIMVITLNNEVLDALDMGYSPTLPYLTWKSGANHSRLLAYISNLFNNETFFDIGTGEATTATALAFNPSNVVHSFDVGSMTVPQRQNVIYHVCNILEDVEWKEKMLDSPLMCLDVAPHDGNFEKRVIDYLASKNYKGIVYMDDVCFSSSGFPGLRAYWETITQKKVNVSKYGGNSSSGIVLFNPEDEIICQ